MKWIVPVLVLLTGACASAQSVTGVNLAGAQISAPVVSGGGGTNITAAFDCRSFGQTASDGGSLNIKYATPIMCWATRTTVSGTAVNDTGWVPEVFFDWDWDDSSLGTVSRGGLTVDLGESVGLVAAHAYKPSTYAETCNGGTNSLHTITLTVYSVVSGARESDTATMSICVENPATTWPNPVAYCDDADCSNDSFTGVTNPGTPSHGGNMTDLATILNSCDATSRRILLEGSLSFTTTSTGVTMGGSKCLIESYGGTQAELKFTGNSTSHAVLASDAACSGVTFNNVVFANTGNDNKKLIAGAADTGCYALIDSAVSTTAGEEWGSITVIDPGGNIPQSEAYYIKFTFNRITAGSAFQGAYIRGNYTAFVGGEISHVNDATDSEHNIRLPQWKYVAIDAMLFEDPQWRTPSDGGPGRKEILTFRHDCGTTVADAVCPSQLFAGFMALTRSSLVNYADGTGTNSNTFPVQWGTPGSGSNEPTKMYDVDVIRNVVTWETNGGSQDQCFRVAGGGISGTEQKRFRFIGNVCDASGISGGTSQLIQLSSNPSDIAIIGNLIVNTYANGTKNYIITSASSSVVDSAKNNGCYENQTSTCDTFTGFVESSDNVEVTSNPFSAAPGQFTTFDFTDVAISNGSAFDDVGVIAPYATDVAGTACDSLYDVGPYCTP